MVLALTPAILNASRKRNSFFFFFMPGKVSAQCFCFTLEFVCTLFAKLTLLTPDCPPAIGCKWQYCSVTFAINDLS